MITLKINMTETDSLMYEIETDSLMYEIKTEYVY